MSLPRKVLEKYITPGCVFIETGTRWGDTCIRAIEAGAKFAHTCETDTLMATIAQMHCDDLTDECVNVQHMDSGAFIGFSGLETSQDKTVVFLDAHTDTSSPVLKELEYIRRWVCPPSAILIDDLRCMHGWGVDLLTLKAKLEAMGYAVGYEDGVVARDIMVGTR
jgi:hypothetical protein